MNVTYKEVKTIKDSIDAIRIRVDVFIVEQKCPPGWEPDELDKKSTHFVAIINKEIVATVRLRKESKNILKIERMAVKKEFRKKGIGLGLTKYVLSQALKKKYKKIWIQAQLHAQKMYEKVGFKVTSEPYDLYNLNILHIDMEYIFS